MRTFLTRVLLIAFLVFLTPFIQFAEARKETKVELDGLNITMRLVQRTAIGQQKEWPEEPISLMMESVPVNGKTVHELLKANHIFPDVEAFGIMYVLNPHIEKLSRLNIAQLNAPVVRAGANLELTFKDGFLILLTLDKEIKDKFYSRVNMLENMNGDALILGMDRFVDQSIRDSTVKSLNNIVDMLKGINKRITQRYGRPIPTEVLSQLSAEAELLNSILSAVTSTGRKMGKADQNQIVAVEKDIKIKAKAFSEVAAGEAPPRWPEVKVMVKTLKQRKEIPNLRIYYVPEALKKLTEEARSFGILSSPSTHVLPEADYCFWAARDPSRTSVTNEQCHELRKDRGQIEVQLTVVRERKN